MKRQRYAPHGHLALDPQAFGVLFDLPDELQPDGAEAVAPGGVAVVEVRGPLMCHREWWFDSYESIKTRVSKAIEAGAAVVVLDIDSPGGLVSGAFDTARALRSMSEDAGVELRAHVGAQATSAAYAMASAATWIGVSESAMIGSIGVIDMMVSATAANAARGLDIRLITSGDRKGDGNPNTEISDDAQAASQVHVDDLAQMFFALVDDMGWGGGVAQIEGMQAGIVHGAGAVELNLATTVATLAEATALVLGDDDADPTNDDGTGATSATGAKGQDKMSALTDAKAALEKAAEGEDEEEAKAARAALAAMEDDPEAEGDDPPKDDEDDPEAEGDEPPKGEDDEEDAKATAIKAMADVHNLRAEIAQEKLDGEREALLASRPDFSEELLAMLKTAPMKMVRQSVRTLKRAPDFKERAAAVAGATGTQGEAQGDPNRPRQSPAAKARMDAKMGLSKTKRGVTHTAHRMTFGAVVPDDGKGL